jgi:hypothetical protein
MWSLDDPEGRELRKCCCKVSKDQRTDSTMGEVPLAISVKPSSNTVIRERSAVAILGACPEVLTMLVLD